MSKGANSIGNGGKTTKSANNGRTQTSSFVSRFKDALSESPSKKMKKNRNIDAELADMSGVSRFAVQEIKDLIDRANTLEEAGMTSGALRLKKQALQMKNKHMSK